MGGHEKHVLVTITPSPGRDPRRWVGRATDETDVYLRITPWDLSFKHYYRESVVIPWSSVREVVELPGPRANEPLEKFYAREFEEWFG